MPNAQLTQAVRSLVAATFSRLGAESCVPLRETILIRSGAYCGRRFETSSGHAIWFVEENQVKFYRADGSVERVLDAPLTERPIARVAA